MLAPKSPQEAARLELLQQYEILDTDPEVGLDDLTRLAASICEVPISAITLIDADRQWFKSRIGLDDSETSLEYSFCSHAILQPQTLIVENAELDPTFADNPAVTAPNGIRFYAGAPLTTSQGLALGTICVADRVPRQLRPDQYRSLEALSRQVQTHLELRIRLRDLRRTTAERDLAQAERAAKVAEIERDLQFARSFQQSLLPDETSYPCIPCTPLRLNFHHVYQPTSSLGGDFFDVVKLSENRAGVFIADVMGHGARSALVTAILRTLFQQLAFQIDDPGELLTQLNARFHSVIKSSDQFLFASACYLIIDTQSGQMHYSSAGHPAPVLTDPRSNRVMALEDFACTGPALGLSSNALYGCCSQSIHLGVTILLYTDGLVEAPNPEGEEFGEERLYSVIGRTTQGDANHFTRSIMDALQAWTGAVPLPDDLCLVAIQVSNESTVSSLNITATVAGGPVHQDG